MYDDETIDRFLRILNDYINTPFVTKDGAQKALDHIRSDIREKRSQLKFFSAKEEEKS